MIYPCILRYLCIVAKTYEFEIGFDIYVTYYVYGQTPLPNAAKITSFFFH